MTSQAQAPEPAEFYLPARLDTDSANELREDLLAMRGAGVELHAPEVTHLGAQCLAVLLAAAKTWRDDICSLKIVNASDDFKVGAQRMGVDFAMLSSNPEEQSA